jgi:alpha(1,3/1,4) fucosyltransferase
MEVYMRNVKIRFVDFWDNHNRSDASLFKLLSKRFQIEISDNPDFIIYSVYGYEHLKYDCVRIFFTAEQCSPDFDICDYAIGYDYLTYGDRYVRIPAFALLDYTAEDLINIDNSPELNHIKASERDFCSYVYSNRKAEKYRREFFLSLSQYKKVDSAGRDLNNTGFLVNSKIDFLSNYKFNIAIENGSYPGYVTEKIMDAFAAGTVPIYFGDPLVAKDFNPTSFINLRSFNTIDDAIKHIMLVDNDVKLYNSYLSSKKFNK